MQVQSLRRTILLALFLTMMLFVSSVQAQDGSMTPTSISLELERGVCTTETINVTTPSTPAPKLDVVFLFDITSSMRSLIDNATSSAGTIMSNVRVLVPDSNFGVGTFGDYGSPYAWEKDADIMSSERSIQSALSGINTSGGGDEPEAYLRALYESQSFSWREDARRIVIIFGDSVAHDPDAGRDERLGTADDLTQDNVLRDLRDADITVLGVYTKERVAYFYEEISEATGGLSFYLEDTGSIVAAVDTLLTEAIHNTEGLTISSNAPGESWVTLSPELYTEVPQSTTSSFEVTFCVPVDADGGEHKFELEAKADGFTIAAVPVTLYVPFADLSVARTNSQDRVDFGEEITYTLTVVNNGPDTATQATLNDTLPTNIELVGITPQTAVCSQTRNAIECNIGDMTVGQQEEITVVLRPTVGGAVNNTAIVALTRFDPDLANNTVTGNATAVAADLSLSQSNAPASINYAESFIYELTVANNGPLPATDATLTSELPAGLTVTNIESGRGRCQTTANGMTCTWDELGIDEVASVQLALTSGIGGDIESEFSLSANEVDPDTSNNALSITTNVIATDLSITVIDAPASIRARQNLTYTLSVSNNGPSPASNVVVTHTVPATVSLTTAVSPQGPCSLSGQTVVCQFNTLNNNQSVAIQIATVPQERGRVVTISEVMGGQADPTLANNQHTETIQIDSQYHWAFWLIPIILVPILVAIGLMKFYQSQNRQPTPPKPIVTPRPTPSTPQTRTGGAGATTGGAITPDRPPRPNQDTDESPQNNKGKDVNDPKPNNKSRPPRPPKR